MSNTETYLLFLKTPVLLTHVISELQCAYFQLCNRNAGRKKTEMSLLHRTGLSIWLFWEIKACLHQDFFQLSLLEACSFYHELVLVSVLSYAILFIMRKSLTSSQQYSQLYWRPTSHSEWLFSANYTEQVENSQLKLIPRTLTLHNTHSSLQTTKIKYVKWCTNWSYSYNKSNSINDNTK